MANETFNFPKRLMGIPDAELCFFFSKKFFGKEIIQVSL
jgi:hypothetical protein